jgi:hypothetical protein
MRNGTINVVAAVICGLVAIYFAVKLAHSEAVTASGFVYFCLFWINSSFSAANAVVLWNMGRPR